MNFHYDGGEMRPILIFAVSLIALGAGGTLFFLFGTSPAPFFSPRGDSEVERIFFYLVLVTNFLYVATGIGVLILKKWGLILFKGILFVAFLAFPIGTIISYMTLRYIRNHRIERHFG